MRRTLFFGLCAAMGLLCVSGAWAQSTNTKAENKPANATAPNKVVDPALLAKATAGDASAEYNLGSAYENGKEAPKDYDQASHWYELAALQGNAAAQCALGLMYEHNEGIPQDYGEAYFWLSIAAQASPKDDTVYPRARIIAERDSAARHLQKETLLQVQNEIDGFVPSHPN